MSYPVNALLAVSWYHRSLSSVVDSANRIFSYHDSGCYVCSAQGDHSKTSILDRALKELTHLRDDIDEANSAYLKMTQFIDDPRILEHISHCSSFSAHQQHMREFIDNANKYIDEIRIMYDGNHPIQQSLKPKKTFFW